MSYDGEDGTVDQSQWEELKWRRDQMAKWSAGGQPPSDGMPTMEELEVIYYNAYVGAKKSMTRRGLGAKTTRETAGRKAGIAAIHRHLLAAAERGQEAGKP